MATPAQITANQKNAQLSSGPVSPEGKKVSSHNAVKTGLTGQTVLLPDNVAAYEAHVARINQQFNPASDEERTLVRRLPTPNGVSSAFLLWNPRSWPSAA